MNIRQLRTFVQVAETGSVTRAASRLHTVQPTLSRHVRQLEEELGSALFERQGRGMALTEAGERLLGHAITILRNIEDARSDLFTLRGALNGSIVCGVIPSLGDRALVPFVRGFAESNPLVALRLVTGYAGFLLEWLARREIDVAVVYDLPGRSIHNILPLAEELLFVVAATTAGLSRGASVRLAALSSVPMILPSPQHGLRQLVDDVTHRHGVTLNVRIEADSLQTQLELARVGLGWTILPPSAIAREIMQDEVSAAPICEPAIMRRIVLALPIDRDQPQAVRRFAEELVGYVTRELDEGNWLGARRVKQ